jgi:hypothetical protein
MDFLHLSNAKMGHQHKDEFDPKMEVEGLKWSL